ncbi:hypothetical protein BKA63DRAFT_561748 [Paraphoma chrysanthemicola]|nr:hypothetical protein BKA63DRAFT_561748 [Paraphoma chrysanthemicola]
MKSATSTTLPPASIPATSSTSTSAQPSSTIFCPGNDGSIVQTSAGSFQVECGIDRSNYDLPGNPLYPGTYEGCLAACARNSDCQQVSYLPGGPCYLKSAVGYPNRKSNFIGGRLLTNGQSASTVTSRRPKPTDAPSLGNPLICPYAGGKTYTSDCGATYRIECGTDRPGNDIAGSLPYVDNLNECAEACDNTPGCVDVSYNPGTPGPCYLKAVVGEARVARNIWGARQLSSCTTNKLKLHRKRVVHDNSVKKPVQKRAMSFNPEFTYTAGLTTITKTSTTTITTTTTTVTPSRSGVSTTTAYTTAYVTANVTRAVTSTVSTKVTATTCPTTRAAFA